jgi:hypothetical protein
VYALPKIPGNHVAQLKESYNIKGLLPAPLICHTKNYCFKRLQQNAVPIYFIYTITTTAISFPAIRERLKLRFRFIKWRVSLPTMAYTTI